MDEQKIDLTLAPAGVLYSTEVEEVKKEIEETVFSLRKEMRTLKELVGRKEMWDMVSQAAKDMGVW